MAGVDIKVRWKGLEQLKRQLRARKEEIVPATEGALFEIGEEVMTQAKAITPVDEGVLRASGHVELPRRDGDRVSVQLGFGGPAGSGEGQDKDVGYAVYVHEDLTAHHTVGQAKFLEVPVNAARETFAQRLVDKIKARLG